MLVRYTTSRKGQPVKQASIYTKDEHTIQVTEIDHDAVKICRRLKSAGHHAYIVGGAVRDLLSGRNPKDFDIVTDASPNRIRKLFRNSRIIGKRFRLVHIFFPGDKIIEVSTFRSVESTNHQNEYGSMEEDAFRRDFTINALYYCPLDEIILDYHDAFNHIQEKKIVPVIPMRRIFAEDPVRMIRAIKYAAVLDLQPGFMLRMNIKRNIWRLKSCPDSRITEEIYKILQTGNSEPVFRSLIKYNMLKYLLPGVAAYFSNSKNGKYKVLYSELVRHDEKIRHGHEVDRSVALFPLLRDYITQLRSVDGQRLHFKEVYIKAKEFLKPVTPANKDVHTVLEMVLRKKKPKRHSRPSPKSRKPRHSKQERSRSEKNSIIDTVETKV